VHTLQKLNVVVKQAATGVCGLAIVCAFAGCGAAEKEVSGTPRVAASGKVEFDGKPLEAGTLSFLNQDSGNTTVITIRGGAYDVDADEGPNPGPNAVMIMGTADGKPMWANAWKGKASVGDTDFAQDFQIAGSDVKPYDPNAAAAKGADAGDTYNVGDE